jgi:anti-sigma B factor antagonist
MAQTTNSGDRARSVTANFSVSCRSSGDEGPHVVTIAGELDLMNVAELRSLLESLVGDVEVDCHDLRFVDSAGIALFVLADAMQRRRGHRLALRRVSGPCYRAFELTGLADHFDVEPE